MTAKRAPLRTPPQGRASRDLGESPTAFPAVPACHRTKHYDLLGDFHLDPEDTEAENAYWEDTWTKFWTD